MLGAPTDAGLYMVAAMPERAEVDAFRADPLGCLVDHVSECEPVAGATRNARPVGKVKGCVRWAGYFRDASGPGWVLTGDAGHHKDPAPGRGIGDALRQAETLAPAIVAGLDGSGAGLDKRLAKWGRERDAEFAEYYWLAADLGRSGPPPTPSAEVLRRLHDQGRMDAFMEMISHRRRPSAVITPPRVIGATARLLARRGGRRALLREVGSLSAQESRRRLLNRRPAYAQDG